MSHDRLVEECRSDLTRMGDLLAELEDGIDDDRIASLFRDAHTLKGNLRSAGFPRAGDLAHAIEDLLGALRRRSLEPTPTVIDAALDGVDALDAALDDIAAAGAVTTDPSPTVDRIRAVIPDDAGEGGGVAVEDSTSSAEAGAAPTAASEPAPGAEGDAEPRSGGDADSEADVSVEAALERASEFDDLERMADEMAEPDLDAEPEGAGSFDDLFGEDDGDADGTGDVTTGDDATAGGDATGTDEEPIAGSDAGGPDGDAADADGDASGGNDVAGDPVDDDAVHDDPDGPAIEGIGERPGDQGSSPSFDEIKAGVDRADPTELDAELADVDFGDASNDDTRIDELVDRAAAIDPVDADDGADAVDAAEAADAVDTVDAAEAANPEDAVDAADAQSDALPADSPPDDGEMEWVGDPTPSDDRASTDATAAERASEALDAAGIDDDGLIENIRSLEPQEPDGNADPPVDAGDGSVSGGDPEASPDETVGDEWGTAEAGTTDRGPDDVDAADAGLGEADATDTDLGEADAADAGLGETDVSDAGVDDLDVGAAGSSDLEAGDVGSGFTDDAASGIGSPSDPQAAFGEGRAGTTDDLAFDRDEDTAAFVSAFEGEFVGEAATHEGRRPERVTTIPAAVIDDEHGEPAPAATGGGTLTVDADQADELLGLAERLTTVETRLARRSDDDPALAEATADLRELSRRLEETVTAVRLQPLEGAIEGLRRTVRDVAREADVEVDLVVDGESVELDRDVVAALGDPLVHLVRNAVAHGIEPPDERERAGKPRTGTVTVRAETTGDEAVVAVEDDGRGIDATELRRRAVEAGTITEAEAIAMDDDEAYRLALRPGLSTAETVTDASGRGVGMDVVDTVATELDGSVSIESEPGQGTTVRLRLPVSLAATELLFVTAGDRQFAVPAEAVEHVGALDPTRIDGDRYLVDGEDDQERRRLVRLSTGDYGAIVHVRESTGPVSIACDAIGQWSRGVVRPYDDLLAGLPGLDGATLLGDGELVHVLDVSTLQSMDTPVVEGGTGRVVIGGASAGETR